MTQQQLNRLAQNLASVTKQVRKLTGTTKPVSYSEPTELLAGAAMMVKVIDKYGQAKGERIIKLIADFGIKNAQDLIALDNSPRPIEQSLAVIREKYLRSFPGAWEKYQAQTARMQGETLEEREALAGYL